MHPIDPTDAYSLGRRFDYLSDATRTLLDDLIRDGNTIRVIKFLRNELGIALIDAKALYEGRKAFLARRADPFGWK
jgi:adenine/guanine phosphoribosyltransferase-like PRPP-binding protein